MHPASRYGCPVATLVFEEVLVVPDLDLVSTLRSTAAHRFQVSKDFYWMVKCGRFSYVGPNFRRQFLPLVERDLGEQNLHLWASVDRCQPSNIPAHWGERAVLSVCALAYVLETGCQLRNLLRGPASTSRSNSLHWFALDHEGSLRRIEVWSEASAPLEWCIESYIALNRSRHTNGFNDLFACSAP